VADERDMAAKSPWLTVTSCWVSQGANYSLGEVSCSVHTCAVFIGEERSLVLVLDDWIDISCTNSR
jgi:hypothetical protein